MIIRVLRPNSRISSVKFFCLASLLCVAGSAGAQNVGINPTGAAGHASAMLDVSATDKGVLFPRVALTDAASASPIASPAAGLLVYNTNPSLTGGYGTGFYYWSGSAWTKMATGSPMASTMADGKIWVGNTSGLATERTLAGDATMNNAGILDLSNLAVETSELNDLAVTTPKLADNSVDGSKISLAANATGDLMYYNGTDWVRLASGSSGQLLRTNGAAAPAWANGNDLFTFENGLTETAPSTVRLGGALTQNTAIGQGGYTMAYTGTATNAFSVDGSTFSVDAANDRVGIGNTAPLAKLHVEGSTYIPSGQSYWIGATSDAGDRLRLHQTGTTAYIDYATGDLVFRAGNTPKVLMQSDGDLQVNNLAGSGNRPVYADASGVLNTAVPVYKVASTLHPSNDDINPWTTIRSACVDDGMGTVNWGFPFVINGTPYTSGWLSTNGVLGFGSAATTAYGNTELPTSISTDPMLFFHWDDDGSNLQRYVVLGNAPNRICYIHSRQSENNGNCTGGASQVDVYITLHESSNVISVRYLGIGSTADVQGASATYGFQFAGGSSAYAVPLGYNAKLLDDNNGSQSFSIDLGK